MHLLENKRQNKKIVVYLLEVHDAFSDSSFLALWQPTAQFPRLHSTVVYSHLQVQGLLWALFLFSWCYLWKRGRPERVFKTCSNYVKLSLPQPLHRVTLELGRQCSTVKDLLFSFSPLKLGSCTDITLFYLSLLFISSHQCVCALSLLVNTWISALFAVQTDYHSWNPTVSSRRDFCAHYNWKDILLCV